MSVVAMLNQFQVRDFECSFVRQIKQINDLVFGISVNENGDEFVQMYDLYKHRKTSQTYCLCSGRIA